MPDIPRLSINARNYAGWTSLRVTRALDRAASDFDLSVSEGWPGKTQNWAIQPFDDCTISIDDDLLLTGFVDAFAPSFADESHGIRVTGRSKTGDLCDCSPLIQSGQFRDQNVLAIANALCVLMNLTMVHQDGLDAGAPFVDANYSVSETCWSFLERLLRMRQILASDTPAGELLLTRAGATRAPGLLAEGVNILAASGMLSAAHRFRTYLVASQIAFEVTGEEGQTNVLGLPATDPACPRAARIQTTIAESMLDEQGATERALWQARRAAGRGIQAHVTLQGWRDAKGKLWQVNSIIPVRSPRLKIDREMTISSVSYILDERGRRTELILEPVEALTPDPSLARIGELTASGWSAVKGLQQGTQPI